MRLTTAIGMIVGTAPLAAGCLAPETAWVELCDPECQEGNLCMDPESDSCLERRASLCDPACDDPHGLCMDPESDSCQALHEGDAGVFDGASQDADSPDALRPDAGDDDASPDGAPPSPDASMDANPSPDADAQAEASLPGCTADTDCTELGAARCSDDGLCVPCTEGVQCAHLGLDACDDGLCTTCTATEGCDADKPACDTAGDVPQCVACIEDSHCEGHPDGDVCDQDGVRCVQCDKDDDSACSDSEVCDLEAGLCVACLSDDDCPSDAPRCDTTGEEPACAPCVDDSACEGRPEGHVCEPSSGACVQCTATDTTACGDDICASRTATLELATGTVDAQQNHCVAGVEPGDAGTCDECLSDAHCGPDALCMPMQFEDSAVGWFCLAKRGEDSCALDRRPYFSTLNGGGAEPVASLDGAVEAVCTLRATTCPALQQFSSTEDLCADATDHDACGVEGIADGFCQAVPDEEFFACTVPCGSNDDCPPLVGVTCGDNFRCTFE